MQKRANRLLSIALVLVLALSLMALSVFATEATASIDYYGITLCDKISMSFYISISDVENTTVNFTCGNQTICVPASEGKYYSNLGCYGFTIGLAAAQMNDEVTVEVVTNDQVVASNVYTVRGYADSILADTENTTYTAKQQEMVLNMLHYGAAAQTYFGHNTDKLANANVSDRQEHGNIADIKSSFNGITSEGGVDGVSLYGRSLLFQSRLAVRFYFTVTGDISDYTFTNEAGTTSYTVHDKGNSLYYVDVTGINPQQICNTVKVKVSDGTNSLTVGYSPMDYIVRKADDTNLAPLMEAMYDYHGEALEYLTYQAGSLSFNTTDGTNGIGYKEDGSIYLVYFTDNNADADSAAYNSNWSVEYSPLSDACITLVRDGEETVVGCPGNGTLVKTGASSYVLKLETWTVGSILPIQQYDYFIVEGSFRSIGTNNTVVIDKTYIYYDGTTFEFSTTEPIIPSTVEGGAVTGDSTWNAVNGDNKGGVYFNLAENAAIYDDPDIDGTWDVRFKPLSADAVQLIRDGETYNIGNTDAEMICKYDTTGYYLEGWPISESHGGFQAGDIVRLNGSFYREADKVTLTVTDSYLLLLENGSTVLCAGAPVTVDGGALSAHENVTYTEGFYFTMAENAAGIDNWAENGGYYRPITASAVKLIRNGVTTNLGPVGSDMITKFDSTGYYCKAESWIMGDKYPLTEGDILLFEGSFYSTVGGTTYILNISRTYAEMTDSGILFYTTPGGTLSTHTAGGGSTGVHAVLAENDLPYDGWSVEYYPLSADTVKLVRDGVTYNVGNTERGTLVKFSATEYYLKYEDGMNEYLPLQPHDYLIVDGVFGNSSNGYSVRINTTYVYYDGRTVTLSDSAPTLPTVVDVAAFATNSTAGDGTGKQVQNDSETIFYLTADLGAAPTSGEYYPAEASGLKLIRGGVTYNIGVQAGTLAMHSSALKIATWTVTDSSLLPIQDTDVLVVEGTYNSSDDATAGYALNIETSYLSYNGTTWVWSETNPLVTYEIDTLSTNSNSYYNENNQADVLYFSATTGNAPVDGEYYPAEASGLRVLRNGVETAIGAQGQGTLFLASNGDHTVKIASWTITDASFYPIQETDIIIVEGIYYGRDTDGNTAGSILKIAKSYCYYNGSAWVWTELDPSVNTVIDAGLLQTNSNSSLNSVIYATMDENAAPYGDGIQYAPTDASCYQVIRSDGTVENIGQPGRGTLGKTSATEYTLEALTGPWAIDQVSITTDDIVVISGRWQGVNGTHTTYYLDITKSYAYYNGSAWVWTDLDPSVNTVVDAGLLQTNSNSSLNSVIYATMDENAAPYGDGIQYGPTDASCYQVIRSDGTVVNIGQPGRGTLGKTSATEYTLEALTGPWAIDGVSITTDDIVVISGRWQGVNDANTNYYLDITKSYAYYNGSAWVWSDTEPADNVYNVTNLASHASGYDFDRVNGNDGIYISHDAHGAEVNGDWSVEYSALTAENIKLVRGGVTNNVAVTGQGTFVAFSATELYLKLEGWTVSFELPMQTGDILILEGQFQRKDTTDGDILNIEKTYIYFDGENLTFSTTEPEKIYQVGSLTAHAEGGSSTGIYANGLENDAPYYDWAAEYAPVSKENIQILRGDQVIYRENTGAGAIIKLGGTGYYVKFDTWIDQTNYPLQAGDIIVIEGDFVGTSNYAEAEGVKIHIDKTYVVYDGTTFTFSDSEPKTIYNVGTLSASSNGVNGTDGFYVTHSSVETPNDGWGYRYCALTADCVQYYNAAEDTLTSVAATGSNEMLVKTSATESYFAVWTLGGTFANLTAGDYYIIGGQWYNANLDVYIEIETTYLLYDGTYFTFSETEPEEDTSIPVVNLTSNGNWSTNADQNETALYFNHDAHTATCNSDWSVEYRPLSADNIQLIRNGETYNIASVGDNGMIVAISATASYLKLASWTVDSTYVPITAGDVIIIQGKFQVKGNSDGDIINVEKTYITLNDDYTTTIVSESDKYIDAGKMMSHDGTVADTNWFYVNGAPSADKGIYFYLAPNIAPSNADWSVEYKATSAGTVKLIRDGVTTDITCIDGSCIIKISDTTYFLKLESWLSDKMPIQDGDQLIIEGEFANASNGYTLNVEKSHISFISLTDDNVVFSQGVDDGNGGEIQLPIVPATMNIGVWNGSHHPFNDEAMQKLRNAGITRIIGIRPQYCGDVEALLDRAEQYGISVILDMRNQTQSIEFNTNILGTTKASTTFEYWDGTLTFSASFTGQAADYTLPEAVLTHPALEGLSACDEPWVYSTMTSLISTAKTKFEALNKKDDLLFFVNLLPEGSGEDMYWTKEYSLTSYTSPDTDYLTNYVNPLLSTMCATSPASWDNYPLLYSDDLGVTGLRPHYFHNFEEMNNTGRTPWYTMLSAGHTAGVDGTEYLTPSADELRWQMAVSLAFGVDNINHYVFGSHESGYTTMATLDSDGNITEWTDLYEDVVTVDNEYKSWEHIYNAYTYIGTKGTTVGTNTLIDNMESTLSLSSYGIQSITTDTDMLIGVFQGSTGYAYMVTNAGETSADDEIGDGDAYGYTMYDESVTLNIGDGFSCAAIIDNGEIRIVDASSGTVTFTVEELEGVFVIPIAE